MRIKKLAVTQEQRIYPIEDLNVSLTTSEGAIDREELIKNNHEGLIKTTTGHEMLLTDASFGDNYNRMKRGAAIIIPKDIGFIIAECNLTKNSVVIDAGAGSGGSTCLLASLCKKVYSFDVNKTHLKTVEKNIADMDLTNVELAEGDITQIRELPEKADLLLLDIPNPANGIESARALVKQGGYVVFYTPHITQAHDVYNSLDVDFKFITTVELIQRRWEIDEKRLRPKHDMLGHTAFLTIVRLFKKAKTILITSH